MFFKRKTPGTALPSGRIEIQQTALWGSSSLSWQSQAAHLVWPTQVDLSQTAWSAAGPSVLIFHASTTTPHGPVATILDSYRTALEPAAWYMGWGALAEEPLVASAPPVLPWTFERPGTIRRLHLLGSPVLRQRATTVGIVDEDVRELVDDLFATMRAEGGVGLAANQVGVPLRAAVVDVGEDDPPPLVLINPRIVQTTEVVETAEEGCLSIPSIYGEVERPRTVTLEALDRDGRPYSTEVSDFKARAVQHEIDHLDGVLFLDHLSAVKRSLLLAKWKKSRKGKSGYIKELAQDRSGKL